MSLISDPKQRGILIVDDDTNVVKVLKSLLEDSGYNNLHAACDGIDALSKLTSYPEKIYLILLDLKMPRMDGFDVVKHLTNVHSHHVGIIIITAFATYSTASHFFKMGTDIVMTAGYMTKPLEIEKLLKEVETTLDMVHKKRMGSLQISAEVLHDRLDKIEDKLRAIDHLPEIKKSISDLSRRNRGFVTEIGMDLIRALVVALALLAFIYLGVGDFLRHIIDKLK